MTSFLLIEIFVNFSRSLCSRMISFGSSECSTRCPKHFKAANFAPAVDFVEVIAFKREVSSRTLKTFGTTPFSAIARYNRADSPTSFAKLFKVDSPLMLCLFLTENSNAVDRTSKASAVNRRASISQGSALSHTEHAWMAKILCSAFSSLAITETNVSKIPCFSNFSLAALEADTQLLNNGMHMFFSISVPFVAI